MEEPLNELEKHTGSSLLPPDLFITLGIIHKGLYYGKTS